MTDTASPGIGHNSPPIAEALADTCAALIAEIEPVAARANALAAGLGDGIKDDATLATVATLVLDAKAVARKIEDRRTVEKEPYLKGGREVDAFFRTHSARLDRIATTFENIASEYQRRKAAEERRAKEEEARKLRDAEEKKRQEAERAKREETASRKQDEADEIAAKADEAEAAARQAARNVEQVKTETGVTIGGKVEYGFEITDYDAIPLDRLRPYFKRDEIEKAIRAFLKTQKGAAKLPGVRFFEDIRANFRR